MKPLNLLVFLLGGSITLPAYLVAIGLILPRPVERGRAALKDSLGKSFLLGLVNLPFFFILALALFRAAQAVRLLRWVRQELSAVPAALLVLVALFILLGLVVLTSIGLASLSRVIAERSNAGSSRSLGGEFRAALLLTLAGMTPYVGWFVFTPFALAVGLGAAIQALFRREAGFPKPAETSEA